MNQIEDYALIGDCRSAALVGLDGSIDWLCFPRFDAPSVFAKILDPDRGGSFQISPTADSEASRAYLEDTNVLVTRWENASGVIEVTDLMPPEDAQGVTDAFARHTLVRGVRCISGTVELSVSCSPRFEYGRFVPRFRQIDPVTVDIVGGADALLVTATHPLTAGADDASALWTLREGEEAWIRATWRRSFEDRPEVAPGSTGVEASATADATIRYWREWMRSCIYTGPYSDMVRRSALALKLMTYRPSGAVIAAPTTSLPESMGGPRNWDYRYTWVRDATLTLSSLVVLGFMEEADAFKTFLERAGAGRPQDLQIMFGIGGERALDEVELTHLSGHRGSRPVRIGNGAATQSQLDSFGQILDAAYLFGKVGGELTADNWRFLAGLADMIVARWRDPDHGIWEVRDTPRHFTHSRVNCWLGLDRAVKIAEGLGLPGNLERWSQERDAISLELRNQAASCGWYSQAAGFEAADSAALLVPALGFTAADDPLVAETLRRVREELSSGGLLYRYLNADGLEGEEGCFLLCSFWMVDCLIYSGRIDEAEALLERLMGLANDVGLLAEEVDPSTGEALGNFPQAFSHMALVLSCVHLAAAKAGAVADGTASFAELAVSHLHGVAKPPDAVSG
ncbi:MAG: glycoside hydrolase family 15 protein [Actinomycetota bacterium]